MKTLSKVTGFLTVLLAIAAFAMIGCGFYQFYQTEKVDLPQIRPLGDSIVKTTIVSDTIIGNPGKKHSLTSTQTMTMHGDHRLWERRKLFSDDLVKARYDMAYKLIYTGIFILLLLMLLPALHEFNILGLLSGTFKDDIKNLKAMHNDSQQQTAAPRQPGALSADILLRSNNDKGRWGGSPAANSRELSAKVTVIPDTVKEYAVLLTVASINPGNPLKGFVVFHLPDYFPNPDPKIFVIGGEASLKLRCKAPFIVGAQSDGGLTSLELDLATVAGFTKD
jgi:hypothetical protein